MSITVVTGQILFITLIALTGLIVQRITRLDITLSCILSGVLFALLIPVIGFDTGIRAFNLKDLVFYIILPILIFESAWNTKPELLQKWLIPILILSIPGLMIGFAVLSGLIYLGIGHPDGFPVIAALITGAILSATDPAAAIAKLKQSNTPQGLNALLEYESLFNDATAVVLFSTVMILATQSQAHSGSWLLLIFVATFLGGIIAGILCGVLIAGLIVLLRSATISNCILIFGAIATFYVSEHLLHLSGVIAVMMAAITARTCLKEKELPLIEGTTQTWEWLSLLFTAILFAIMGLTITFDMFSERWLAIAIVIPITLIARAISVYLSCFISRLLNRAVSYKWQTIMVWGGLRGAVAIALVLSLPTSLPYWWTIQSMVFGLVLFSLIVQSSSIKYLAQKMKVE